MAYKPNMEDIKKLRAMTGAGLADVKKALTEAEGDFEKAKDLLRERGLAIAAKRSDRETSNGCVLVKIDNGFAAIIALKCETDFVANGADFIALTQAILDAAVANKCKTLDEVKELTLADGQKVQDAVTQRSGITGEKMELDGYNFLLCSGYDTVWRTNPYCSGFICFNRYDFIWDSERLILSCINAAGIDYFYFKS